MKFKNFRFIAILCFILAFSYLYPVCTGAEENNGSKSVRKERNFIRSGNELFKQAKYRDAIKSYQQALNVNPSSAVGRFNLGLSQIKIGNVADTTNATQEILKNGVENLNAVASMGAVNPKLAGYANYNLGNLAFQKQDYSSAISSYKQALRLNPDDNNARRNLRIAQLKKQEQDKNKQDQNKDQNKQDQNKDQQKDKEQQKDQNQQNDQNKDQNKDQDKQTPPPPQQQDMSQQTADRILQAMENKESQTRQRIMSGKGSTKGEKAKGQRGGRLQW